MLPPAPRQPNFNNEDLSQVIQPGMIIRQRSAAPSNDSRGRGAADGHSRVSRISYQSLPSSNNRNSYRPKSQERHPTSISNRANQFKRDQKEIEDQQNLFGQNENVLKIFGFLGKFGHFWNSENWKIQLKKIQNENDNVDQETQGATLSQPPITDTAEQHVRPELGEPNMPPYSDFSDSLMN